MFIVKGDSALWTWGNGENYQLGFDSKASFSTPQLVPLSETVVVLHGCLNPQMHHFLICVAYCGVDGTMISTKQGRLYACGNNAENKLGLNSKGLFTTHRLSCRCSYFCSCRSSDIVKYSGKFEPLKALSKGVVTSITMTPTCRS
jgi:NIMA (never in mitosis gene a)-related kinase